MFPFDVSGTVRVPTAVRSNSATVKAVANRLAAMLDEKDCSEVFIEGNRVRFTNALFGGTIRFGWSDYMSSFLSGFGSGAFDIEAAIDGITIRFSLSMVRQWIGFALLAAFWWFVPPRPTEITWPDGWPFLLPVLGFFVLYYAFIWGRTWFWLKRGLEGVSELSMRT